MSSLEFFNLSFMSLRSPHLILSTAKSLPAQVTKATIKEQMLSRRYRYEHLFSFWSIQNSEFCHLAPSFENTPEDSCHILSKCDALKSTRENLLRL